MCHCKKCGACMKIVVGLLLLAWANWFAAVDWRIFFGGLLVVGGLAKLFAPKCSACEACCSIPAPKGKKK